MKEIITKFEHVETKKESTYGGFTLLSTYEVTTNTNNFLNFYTITTEVRGINTGEPYMDWYTSEIETTYNNEETLTNEALINLIEEYKQ